MKANDFDEYFDDGGSVMPFADMSKAERPNLKASRINAGFPTGMAEALDKEAAHFNVSCQALKKGWIANCLTHTAHTAPMV